MAGALGDAGLICEALSGVGKDAADIAKVGLRCRYLFFGITLELWGAVRFLGASHKNPDVVHPGDHPPVVPANLGTAFELEHGI